MVPVLKKKKYRFCFDFHLSDLYGFGLIDTYRLSFSQLLRLIYFIFKQWTNQWCTFINIL